MGVSPGQKNDRNDLVTVRRGSKICFSYLHVVTGQLSGSYTSKRSAKI